MVRPFPSASFAIRLLLIMLPVDAVQTEPLLCTGSACVAFWIAGDVLYVTSGALESGR
jgi:hypothetical protein